MVAKSSYLIIGVFFGVLLVSSTSLAFGTHETDLWNPSKGVLLEPVKDGNKWLATLTFQEPIAEGSPECLKLNGAQSPDCYEKSLYQITGFESWKEAGTQVGPYSCASFETEHHEVNIVEQTTAESFSKTVGRSISIGASNTVTTDVSTTVGAEAGFEGFGLSAKISYEGSWKSGSAYTSEQSEQTSSEIRKQTDVGYLYQTESGTRTTIGRDLSDSGFIELQNQLVNNVKYDL